MRPGESIRLSGRAMRLARRINRPERRTVRPERRERGIWGGRRRLRRRFTAPKGASSASKGENAGSEADGADFGAAHGPRRIGIGFHLYDRDRAEPAGRASL